MGSTSGATVLLIVTILGSLGLLIAFLVLCSNVGAIRRTLEKQYDLNLKRDLDSNSGQGPTTEA